MNWKIIILLVISMLLLNIIAINDYFTTMEWKSFYIGLIPSVIASIIIYIFSDNTKKQTKKIKLNDLFEEIQDTSILESIIDKSINKLNKKNFNRVDLNRNMGENYWIDHIAELNDSKKEVWAIGSGMSLWLENKYKTPLKKKIIERFINICDNKNKKHSKIYILLLKEESIQQWQILFNEIIEQATEKYYNSNKNNCKDLLKKYFIIKKIENNNLKYSIVKCGDNISISMRTNSGRSGDSPTLDIKSSSTVGQYFLDDLKVMNREYNLDE
jgi:hypothetical protein